jgi:ureidoacrylate peracid hydrolase
VPPSPTAAQATHSDAHALLTSRGIDTLIITGCATNICCESTARDAMMLTFADVIDVEDMTAMLTRR